MKWFLPYLYHPHPEARYRKLVTPLGNVHLENLLMQQIGVTLLICFITGIVFFIVSRKRRTRYLTPVDKSQGRKKMGAAQATESAKSALEENILLKGKNSYYYAHQQRETTDKEEQSVTKTMVSSYGWTDKKKSVSIYLTDDAVVNMADDQLVLKWTATSFSMDLLTESKGSNAKSLVIPTLFSEISDVTWKAKGSQLTITLHKSEHESWKSLNGAAKKLEDHIEYDEALYD